MRTFSLFAATRCLLLASVASFSSFAHAEHEPHSDPVVRVGIVLFDGVEIIDFAGPYEVFGAAGFGVVTLTSDGKPVTTAMGLKVTPDTSFADAPAFDVLMVPGGDVHVAEADAAVLDFIRARSRQAKSVMSVCTGARILAASGLLDGAEATTFHRALDRMTADFPKVVVVRDRRWVDAGKVTTSAGLSSGIDTALHVVEKFHGDEAARSVALRLEYDWRRGEGFVRTRMADRYIPKDLERLVQWPEDIQFEDLRAVGDRGHWRSRYRVTTATPTAEVMTRIATGMGQVTDWHRDGKSDRWTTRAEGHDVSLTFGTEPDARAHSFVLTSHVAVK